MNGGETAAASNRRPRSQDSGFVLWRDLGRIAALRAALSICLLIAGFRAISDDDFARVVIALRWAHAPTLDPSGTSWLPFPFWLNGVVMWLARPSLFLAQLVAAVVGIASSCFITLAAHQITRDRKASLLAGGFSVVVGWPAWLGVATVPELLTASLTLFAAASLTSHRGRDRFGGGLALLCATLSRYEPWPLALGFAAWTVLSPPIEGVRELALERHPSRLSFGRAMFFRLGPAALSLLGPLLWIEWNRIAHGDRFHFVARVAAYHRAFGQGQNESIWGRLLAYPWAFVREMPEVVLLLVLALVLLRRFANGGRRAFLLAALRRNLPSLALSLLQGFALSVSLVKDGAPTHHPERALLFPALALLVFACDCANAAPKIAWGMPGRVVACLLFLRAVFAPLLIRSESSLRSVRGGWLLLYAAPSEAFANRMAETEIGALAAVIAGPQGKVYFEVAEDYGYFAVQAAFAHPHNVVLSREVDPRNPQEARVFETEEQQAKWLRAQGVSFVIGAASSPETTQRFGKPPVKWNAKYGVWAL